MMSKRLSQDSGPQATRPNFGSDAASHDTGSKMNQMGAGSSRTWCRMAWCLAPLVALCLTASHSAAQGGPCNGKFCPNRLAALISLDSTPPQTLMIYYGQLCDGTNTTYGYFVSPYVLPTGGNCNNCTNCIALPGKLAKRKDAKQTGVTKPVWHQDLLSGIGGYFNFAQDVSNCDNLAIQEATVNVKVTRQDNSTEIHTFKLFTVYSTAGPGAQEYFAFEVPLSNPSQIDYTATNVANDAKVFAFDAPPVGGGTTNVTYQAILKK